MAKAAEEVLLRSLAREHAARRRHGEPRCGQRTIDAAPTPRRESRRVAVTPEERAVMARSPDGESDADALAYLASPGRGSESAARGAPPRSRPRTDAGTAA